VSLAGVDVSAFQGQPGAWKARAGPITWAAVKFTELQPDGVRYVNPDAAADWAYLHEQGKGRIAYLFAHPGTSASETASFFLAQMARAGTINDTDMACIDLEVSDGATPPKVSAWTADVAGAITAALRRPAVLYTFLSFAWAGNCAGLGHLPLWIADPSSPAGKPRVPSPWTGHAIHQFSTAGGIDRDVANYASLAAMQAALGAKPKKGTATVAYTADGTKSLHEIASSVHGSPSYILRLTAVEDGKFPDDVAKWLDSVVSGHAVPKGCVLRLPA